MQDLDRDGLAVGLPFRSPDLPEATFPDQAIEVVAWKLERG
jgi:hypothetical protein